MSCETMNIAEPLISTHAVVTPETTFSVNNSCQRLLGSQFRTCKKTLASTSTRGKLPRKIVRWDSSVVIFNDTPTQRCQARVEQMRQHEVSRAKNKSPPPPVTPEALHHQMERLEYRIHQTVRLELKMLNDAKETRNKLDLFVKMHRAMCGCDFIAKLETKQRSMSQDDLADKVRKLELKVDKAARVEKSLLKKSMEIRRKRYRLTKLYELSCRELQRQSSSGGKMMLPKFKLPPTLSSATMAQRDVKKQAE